MMTQERRKFPRKPILESFHVFVVVPERGAHRLRVHDVSAEGISFDYDVDSHDGKSESKIEEGGKIAARFYLNPTLFLSLDLEIMRIEKKGGIRRIGACLKSEKSSESKAFSAFVDMIEVLTTAADLQA